MDHSDIKGALRDIKQRFMLMRNGMMGEQLRRAGLSYRIIFGLNLPQLADLARSLPHDPALARALRDNTSTRESMLLAPMLFPPEALDRDEARRWAADCPTPEVADILCHRLLRRLPWAPALAAELLAPGTTPMERYAGTRLLANLLQPPASGNPELLALLEKEAETSPIARQVLENL